MISQRFIYLYIFYLFFKLSHIECVKYIFHFLHTTYCDLFYAQIHIIILITPKLFKQGIVSFIIEDLSSINLEFLIDDFKFFV